MVIDVIFLHIELSPFMYMSVYSLSVRFVCDKPDRTREEQPLCSRRKSASLSTERSSGA